MLPRRRRGSGYSSISARSAIVSGRQRRGDVLYSFVTLLVIIDPVGSAALFAVLMHGAIGQGGLTRARRRVLKRPCREAIGNGDRHARH
jgi:hypothetical protein